MILVLQPDHDGVWRADRVLLDQPRERLYANCRCTTEPIFTPGTDGWLSGDSVADAWRSFRAEWFA